MSAKLEVELKRAIMDEKIVKVFVRLSASWKLDYDAASKNFLVTKGILAVDLYSMSAEVSFKQMVSLVEEALRSGKSEITIQTKLWGSADNSHCRDIQEAEQTGEATIWLNLEGGEPVLSFSAQEFYDSLCSL